MPSTKDIELPNLSEIGNWYPFHIKVTNNSNKLKIYWPFQLRPPPLTHNLSYDLFTIQPLQSDFLVI